MYYLGIPTTRAGTVITSDSTVERDPYYDGNNIHEKCAIISRIAPNFFRFGSFEIFKQSSDGRAGPSADDNQLKKQLLDHVLLYYPDITRKHAIPTSTEATESAVYAELYKEIVTRTAVLVAKWQTVGFVHGVLNTDNMSIMGLTIDYGPYGFLEHFDPEYTPNGSDNTGRYSYENQVEMCKWNLLKLAEVFAPYVSPQTAATILNDVEGFDTIYEREYVNTMCAKLGLSTPHTMVESCDSVELIESLFECMAATHADFTDTFIALTGLAEALDAMPTDQLGLPVEEDKLISGAVDTVVRAHSIY